MCVCVCVCVCKIGGGVGGNFHRSSNLAWRVIQTCMVVGGIILLVHVIKESSQTISPTLRSGAV